MALRAPPATCRLHPEVLAEPRCAPAGHHLLRQDRQAVERGWLHPGPHARGYARRLPNCLYCPCIDLSDADCKQGEHYSTGEAEQKSTSMRSGVKLTMSCTSVQPQQNSGGVRISCEHVVKYQSYRHHYALQAGEATTHAG